MTYVEKPPVDHQTPYQSLLKVLTHGIVEKAANRDCSEEELLYWLSLNENDVNITEPVFNESIGKWESVIHVKLFDKDITIPVKFNPITVLTFFKQYLKAVSILDTPFDESTFYITEETEKVLLCVKEDYDFTQGIKSAGLYLPTSLYRLSPNKKTLLFSSPILIGEIEIVIV